MSEEPVTQHKPQRYATASNPTITAVVHAMYRFNTEEEARNTLDVIAQHFVASRQQIRNDAHPSLHLWIKGYALEEKDKAQGIIGHYAIITYKQVEGGRWMLYATKIETPAGGHPQRAQIKRDNPNWGHPIIRSIRKGRTYKTLEHAQSELALLHEQFPKVSIPNPGKLYIMIYCADRPPKERMVKHKLEIATLPDGSYRIECKENTPKLDKKKKDAPVITPADAEPKVNQGYFTAQVALGRVRKNKKPIKSKKPETEAEPEPKAEE